MFRRVLLENWQESVPYVCFALIAGAFAIILIRAICMKPSEIEKLSTMPLNDGVLESSQNETPSDTDQK